MWWSRRWPERVLGSVIINQHRVGMRGNGMSEREGTSTFGIELQDVDVAICVCCHHVELFAVGEEVGGYNFDVVR